MLFITPGNNRKIEEDLLTLDRRYIMFFYDLGGIVCVPFKTGALRRNVRYHDHSISLPYTRVNLSWMVITVNLFYAFQAELVAHEFFVIRK